MSGAFGRCGVWLANTLAVKNVANASDQALLRFFVVTFAVSWGC